MTGPVFLPSPDQIHKTSLRLLSFSCTDCSISSYVFISLQVMFSIFLHTHIKRLQSPDNLFLVYPGFSCIESYTPYYSFDNYFLYVLFSNFCLTTPSFG